MTPSQGTNPGTCPKCSSPLISGTKFCESCGAKIEQSPACVHCGAPLVSGVKFCEACGTPVGAPPAPAPVDLPVPPVVQPPAVEPAPAEVKIPAPEPSPVAAETKSAPDKKIPEQQKKIVQDAPEKTPASRTRTLVIAGVVGLVIIAALAYFVLLPALSGTGTTGSGKGGSPLSTGPTPVVTTPSVVPSQNTASASFVPEPTRVPPANLLVTYQAERDPLTGLVTVTFTGGAGQHGVSDVSIRLSRSDGQVLTQTFSPRQIGSFVTLQGTKMTDRIEVIANYYNGDKYRIIDQLFEYKKKF